MYSYNKQALLGKSILVTGGTGFMGSAIIKELLWGDSGVERVCSLSRRWNDSEQLSRELDDSRFYEENGDIRDGNFVNRVMRDGNFDLVIHAAAYKSVPSGQRNPEECVSVNVKGSVNVANAAKDYGVRAVIGISSDKACEPINVYGQSKAIMEQIFINSVTDKTNFIICRYGNVIGSSGSVIPLFVKQLKNLQNLTVTDYDMTRFWFKKQDAVNFVLLAGSTGLDIDSGYKGKIFVPELSSLSMYDLAWYMIDLFRKDPFAVPEGFTISTDAVGRRQGEKLHESMIGEHEDRQNIYLVPPYNAEIQNAASPLSSKGALIYNAKDIDNLLLEYLREQFGLTD